MLSRAKDFLLELVFPVRCVGCRTEGEWFCGVCAKKVRLNEKQFCPLCWQENFGGRLCENCEASLAGLRVAASYERNPELAEAVKTLKYKFSEPLARNLGELLARAVAQKSYASERVVSFIPLHKKRQRWRGFNQAELLARFVAANLGLPLAELLVRTKNTSQQAKLSREERLQNLRDAFALRPDSAVAGKTVILVDDIASTGSTLLEAAKILRSGGAREVWGLVLARG
ncbi:MAG: ComF family protein [Patescibacteria group bacterium]